MKDAVATDGPPPPREAERGPRVSDRFQRSRVPTLPTILYADASEDYRAMARDALLEGRNATDMRTVGTGGELLGYLQRPPTVDGALKPVPSLIVLDADLPGEPPGLEAVRAIKRDPALRRIPVVALGTGADSDTIAEAYEAGANTYIVKPVTFLALVRLMKIFTAYWLETAELPPGP
jgi:CheY-like chemotaxis protein